MREAALADKYKFCDITVYIKVHNSDRSYISLTDLLISDCMAANIEEFDMDADYIIAIEPYRKNLRMLAPVTLDELQLLARVPVKTQAIVSSFIDKEEADEFMAHVCAKKIFCYEHGKIVRTGECEYEFQKMSWETGDKGKHRKHEPIFRKTFIPDR